MIDLTPLFQALIALLAALVTAFLLPWLREKGGQARLERLQKIVSAAAQAAEQLFREPGSGREKKSYVFQKLEEAGYTVDESLVEPLLEAAVRALGGKTPE